MQKDRSDNRLTVWSTDMTSLKLCPFTSLKQDREEGFASWKRDYILEKYVCMQCGVGVGGREGRMGWDSICKETFEFEAKIRGVK